MKFFIFTLIGGFEASAASLGVYRVFEKLSAIPQPWIKQDIQIDTLQSFKLRIISKTRTLLFSTRRSLTLAPQLILSMALIWCENSTFPSILARKQIYR
jgi:hypothetical protein